MPSSTSNFDSNFEGHVPRLPYLKMWSLVAVLVCTMLGGAEIYWRSVGHTPSVTDDMLLWSYYRSQVYTQNGIRRIVLLGSSRIQLGVVPEVLEQQFPSFRVIQLPVDGSPGYAAFKDLAEDPDFDGIIIYDTTEGGFFPESQKAQEPWVNFYRKTWDSSARYEKILNLRARLFLQSRIVLFNSLLNLKQQVLNRFSIHPSYVSMLPNRYRPAYYYDKMTPEQLAFHRKQRVERTLGNDEPSTPEHEAEFAQILRSDVAPLVEKLHSKGGDVIFLRMPTTGEQWQIDESRHPKAKYWDKMHALVGAETIHFKDVESLAHFDCPDTSHLDATEAPEFTARLAVELANRNAIHTETEPSKTARSLD
ncbi:MAG: hypothetical protein IT328_14775 [Caldilineaceae bacterium]|nr:hypothetical protein [Caldilineaceae bacterium]